ncbi:MAG: AI-2E family transporter [Parcubacteria group bacterium]|nr:AI-2E family transporter [Parcubacteria group bacterium]
MENLEAKNFFNISVGTIIKIGLVIVGFIFLYLIRDILAVILMSIVIASAIEPVVNILTRGRPPFLNFGLPRFISIIIVYLFIFALLVLLVYLVTFPLAGEIAHLSQNLPDYIQRLLPGFNLENQVRQLIQKLPVNFEGLAPRVFEIASTTFNRLTDGIAVLILSFYLVVIENGVENFLRYTIPNHYEEYAVDLWKRTKRKIGFWLQGQFLLGLIVGFLVFIGLSILNFPFALVLAILAALLEIIPIVGPILAAIPAIAIGFLQSPTLGLGIFILYFAVQQIESHVIVPNVLRKIVGLNPIFVIIALLVGARLGGLFGLFLAVPAAGFIMELLSDFVGKKKSEIV